MHLDEMKGKLDSGVFVLLASQTASWVVAFVVVLRLTTWSGLLFLGNWFWRVLLFDSASQTASWAVATCCSGFSSRHGLSCIFFEFITQR